MAGHPSARDLVAAVREFIAGLALEGREGFHAKVAANALAIVEREMGQGPDAAELDALSPFINDRHPGEPSCHPREGGDPRSLPPVTLGPRLRGDDNSGAIRSAICTALRDGTLAPATPGLGDALVTANLARLAVDNPRYSTFLRRTATAAPQR